MTIRMREHPSLMRSSAERRMFAAGDGVARQVNPADAAQARLFESILEVEVAQLQQLAMVLASRCGTHSVDDDHLPETYSELTARIQDVHRLLERLRDRFPHRPG
ncbi:hypothetical protein [Mycobacterium xenopi]|uniref:hypothetical protein n=1 Tax=Mycobacterium xenopi TaxID=1789 RepID=UPI0002E0765F|nr:hypothetical protein [Mycobacterium xenopi]MDA3640294.1 hypothetical protein [Mycobacterium xenopi]MDA3658457.1 hypothetical protein [Mycobacterium xenopi]MDA3662582.1 hypothetical protein [Mycobacterium xenopi]